MKVNILSNKVPWFGKYSGYECLPNYFPDSVNSNIYVPHLSFLNKAIGKYYQAKKKWNFKRPEEVLNEVRFLNNLKDNEVAHILYLEGNIHLVNELGGMVRNTTGTIHFPFSRWTEHHLKLLSKMQNVIILYKEELEKFSQFISREKIHVIKHGVDVDFFRPKSKLIKKNKILFVGHFLRNFEMFLKVYKQITSEIAEELEFHFIIPASFRSNFKELVELAEQKNVFFHEKLSDEELLEQYQSSYVLLMPMEDSGANTAIVQAVAVGLPIITTDVGGIRSYGGCEIFPVVENNDCDAMVKLFKHYYFDQNYRNQISAEEREYAVKNLDWKVVASQHIELYDSLNSGRPVNSRRYETIDSLL